MVPGASTREDFCPQAILKVHRLSSLDYRARHGPPELRYLIVLLKIILIHQIVLGLGSPTDYGFKSHVHQF